MTRTVVVVGGFGTIGGRLGELLLDRGNRVVLAGRSIPGSFVARAGVEAIRLDVTTDDLASALDGADAVVHLAAMNDPVCRADPALAEEVNVGGLRRVADGAASAGVPRLVYLSTAQVYGTPYVGHVTEATPTRPSTVYASTHLAAEEIVAARHAAGDFIGVRIRLANGFGVPSRTDNDIWHVVVNDLVRSAVSRGEMILRGSGTERRNFVSFGSACAGIAHLLDLPDVGRGLFNLGSAETTTTRGVAQLVADRVEAVLGVRPVLRILGVEEGTSPDLDYDCRLLASTGFSLEQDPEPEIDDLIDFCARHFGRAA
jgi:UDP-glucose 4-epimerase